MPTYIYRCTACAHQFEEMQKISASPLVQCPHCHQPTLLRKPGGGIGLNFIGAGFYINDYAENPKCCPCGKTENSCKPKS